MGAVKTGFKVVGGQVPVEVANYLKAFAKAKGSTVSKQLALILDDWHHRRGIFSEVDRAAHRVVEESKTDYGGPSKSPPSDQATGTNG